MSCSARCGWPPPGLVCGCCGTYAEEFGYRADKLKLRDGAVVAPDGRSASFGSLTAAAAKLPGKTKDELHPVQQTWLDQDVSQCGYAALSEASDKAAYLQ